MSDADKTAQYRRIAELVEVLQERLPTLAKIYRAEADTPPRERMPVAADGLDVQEKLFTDLIERIDKVEQNFHGRAEMDERLRRLAASVRRFSA